MATTMINFNITSTASIQFAMRSALNKKIFLDKFCERLRLLYDIDDARPVKTYNEKRGISSYKINVTVIDRNPRKSLTKEECEVLIASSNLCNDIRLGTRRKCRIDHIKIFEMED